MNVNLAQKHLTIWLNEDLPSISKQKRQPFRPTINDAKQA